MSQSRMRLYKAQKITEARVTILIYFSFYLSRIIKRIELFLYLKEIIP